MKQENIVKPPPQPCAVCKVLTDKPYGRTINGVLCSKKCSKIWDETRYERRPP
jgi:hypothetical protein